MLFEINRHQADIDRRHSALDEMQTRLSALGKMRSFTGGDREGEKN